MAKEFASRVSKRNRVKKDIASHLGDDFFRFKDEKLLQGARLDDIELASIEVRKQVRTKFNDDSIAELAANIKENGLIQPLVVHREGSKFVLICGERRFRAMTTLTEMKMAPCFILEDKTDEELMAIQFSENSAREQLHYIDQADSIYGYKKLTGASERKIQAALGISKSEVHRCILIAKIAKKVKEAAKIHNTEKYVLLEWSALEKSKLKEDLKKKIIDGVITKRLQLKRAINAGGGVVKAKTKSKAKPKATTKSASAALLIKAMKSKSKDMKLDRKTQKMLKELMDEAKELIDM
ncbi:MAG: ParB/RepB/Spo0J family partition protein [Bacteriovoracaceae bacterium]|jgi:ParB family chromosome partitioning protein|nr:ParB/RepB/Spo0J family partition protein [Bacteriovoracaceae bacterium]